MDTTNLEAKYDSSTVKPSLAQLEERGTVMVTRHPEVSGSIPEGGSYFFPALYEFWDDRLFWPFSYVIKAERMIISLII